MKVLFVAGFGPIVQDMETSQRLYGEALAQPGRAPGRCHGHTVDARPGGRIGRVGGTR
jgi:hypothetical protein